MPSSLPTRVLALTIATGCGSADDANPSDTDATTGPTTSSPTSIADDAPPLDSTDGGPGTVGPDTDTDTSGMTEGPTDGSGSTDDGPIGCTSDDECTEADAPFCVQMICSPCSAEDDPDAACAEKFPETPACSASTCVQCAAGATGACVGTTPICDTGTNTCVGCTAHDQCDGDAACDIETGECFPADAVFYVDGDAGCSDAGPGTMAMPWCALQTHVDDLGAGDAATFYVGELNAGAEYPALTITGGRSAALLAMEGQLPRFRAAAGSTLAISSATTSVYLEGLRFQGNGSAVAITVSDALLFAQRCEVVSNNLGGRGRA